MGAVRVAKWKAAGEFLKDLRERKGYETRRSFAKACEGLTTYDHLSDVETGRTQPMIDDLLIYKRLTGCDAETILQIPLGPPFQQGNQSPVLGAA